MLRGRVRTPGNDRRSLIAVKPQIGLSLLRHKRKSLWGGQRRPRRRIQRKVHVPPLPTCADLDGVGKGGKLAVHHSKLRGPPLPTLRSLLPVGLDLDLVLGGRQK
jgi:hypothetical protein